MIPVIAIIATVGVFLLREVFHAHWRRKATERDALQKIKEYQLAIIVEASKKKAKIDDDTEAEKSKLPDMSKAELERKVNE